VLTFVGDSAIGEITSGAQVRVDRFKTTSGAVPYLNPSFALMELVLVRARAIGGDSVDVPVFQMQGAMTIPFTVVRRGADSVVITAGRAVIRLNVSATDEILGGTLPSQGLHIVRVRNATDAGMAPARRDYSAPPGAPYTAEAVRIPTPAGYALAGTLTMPRDAKRPVAALVTITGSGQEDRDEAIPTVPGYALFRQIADTLARNGIAVLRMDDRGFGESGGDPMMATSADFADDIRAGLAYLRARPDIDAKRLGLIGHSEGGEIAPMIAAGDSSLRGIVLMAGPAWTGRRVIEYQNRYAVDLAPRLTARQRDSLMNVAMRVVDSTASRQPWLRFFLAFDPLPVARRVRTPVLILQGETDRQVTAAQATELGNAVQSGGNRDVTVRVFPRANHLFLDDADGSPLRYGQLPSHAVRSDVLGALVEWTVRHFR
jgi:dipeptidyl aminopeptidase/acylaminoacyl peptidase